MPGSLSKVIGEISKIPPLQGQEDWPEWRRRLQGLLRVQGLWKVLTGEVESKDGDDPTQEQLASMLQLICAPSARAVINLYETQSATKQFQALKEQYGTANIVIYSTLMHTVFRSSFFDYGIIREYYEAVSEAKNRLANLGRPMDELAIVISFI